MAHEKHRTLLRRDGGHEHHRVTFVELFFDLVFVFAVTQLSHALLAHLTVLGVVQTILLLMAVWWVWMYTCWATNWLDPDRIPVRLMLFAMMLAGLVLSTSIPAAFGTRGIAFAGAYVAMQVGRTVFVLLSFKPHHAGRYENFQRILVWLCVSAVFWIAGALLEGERRLILWIVALAIEYLGPSARFWVPRWGGSDLRDWQVDGGHMAERCGLFIIIALGESVLVTGATFAELAWTAATIAAFSASFVASVAMWWIYFNIGAERGSRAFAASDDTGRMARLSYTYLHLPLVAGIIVTAVADERVLAHPLGPTGAAGMAVIVAGPALYILGNYLFKRTMGTSFAFWHLVGLGLLAPVALAYPWLPPLALSGLTTAILATVAVWETVSLGRAPAGKPAADAG